jgi:Fe2+ or Zn2+ uptake regulation protein/O6-methylguanine-DNA--protein-cysteine methyltransferase
MSPTSDDPGELLRARGMRSTPQRRAILAAFDGGPVEHLSADEVFARAAQSVPDLSRGTVYATLAEFTEAGLLAAFGTPEPVRYEKNTERHAHFRCRLCLRLFDLDVPLPDPEPIERRGFRVERIDLRAEGTCEECLGYAAGLRAGARSMSHSGGPGGSPEAPGTRACELDSPLGPLLLAATAAGLTRLAFAEHADVPRLRSLAASRRGSTEARDHLRRATVLLGRYFSEGAVPECAIDWSRIPGTATLQATLEIPYSAQRSYSDLGLTQPAREIGRILGANPIPILTPCHRVSRGVEAPVSYVGGLERRHWLVEHERGQPRSGRAEGA